MAHRITAYELDRLAELLSTNLGRPESPYSESSAQPGNIHVENNGYGYSVQRMLTTGGAVHSYDTGMTAKECAAWLWGALDISRELGFDRPISKRWDGRNVCGTGIGVLVRYIGPTNRKGSRWQAKHHERGTAYGTFADGPIAAAIRWAEKVGLDSTSPRYIIQLTPDLYAVEF